MLFKHGHLEKKLRENGRAATAEILSIKTEGSGGSARALFSDDSDLTTTWFYVRLKLRVRPDGEAPFEVTVHSRLSTMKWDGETVPVLYDPDDHSKVVVDYKLDAQQAMDSVKLGDDLERQVEAQATAHTAASVADGDALEKLVEAEAAAHAKSRPSGAGSGGGSGSGSDVEQLERLAALRDSGVLSQDEFEAEKAKIVGG